MALWLSNLEVPPAIKLFSDQSLLAEWLHHSSSQPLVPILETYCQGSTALTDPLRASDLPRAGRRSSIPS